MNHTLCERKNSTFSLSLSALELIVLLGKNMGLGKSAVIETAVRDLAKREKVKLGTED